ncbi:hypothetical protein L218DRAFT_215914 [Marasmius fiardii PR-910]|nr:hypothetical protein L218DRAFT_215914 [Marasmius fiardii PR-910]
MTAQSVQAKNNTGPSAAFPSSKPVSSATTTTNLPTPSSRDVHFGEPGDSHLTSFRTENDYKLGKTTHEPSPTTHDHLFPKVRSNSQTPSITLPSEFVSQSKASATNPEPSPPIQNQLESSLSVCSVDENRSLIEQIVESPPRELDLVVSSEDHSSLVTVRNDQSQGNVLIQTPQPAPESMIVARDTPMEVDDDDNARADIHIDVEETRDAPLNDENATIHCHTTDEMEVDAQLTSTEIVPGERVVDAGAMSEGSVPRSGSEGSGYATTPKEGRGETAPVPSARTLCSRQPTPGGVPVSITPENREKSSAAEAIVDTRPMSEDIYLVKNIRAFISHPEKKASISDLAKSTPLRSSSRSVNGATPTLVAVPKMPQTYLPVTDGFNVSMKVIACHPTPAYGGTDFVIQLTESQMQNVMAWNRRRENLQGQIHKSTCLSLACYREKDIQDTKQLAYEGEIIKKDSGFFNKIRSAFPTSHDLEMRITQSNGKTHKLALSPPLYAFLTPDGHVDLGMYMNGPVNKLRLQRSRRGVEGDFVFVLHAHPPTRAQLLQLEKKAKDGVVWQDWLTYFSRPFDLSSSPFTR